MAIWLQWLLAVQLSLFVPILTSPNARDVLCVCVRVSPPPLVNCDCFQMGMGKTIQTIALIVHRPSTAPPRRPTLVVAPTVALFQWRAEIEAKTAADAVSVLVYYGSNRKRDVKFIQSHAKAAASAAPRVRCPRNV